MHIVFSDAQYWEAFLPLTFTRPIAEMRCGILTFSERWQKLLGTEDVAYITEDFLQNKYRKPKSGACLFLIPNFLPTKTVLDQIKNLQFGEALVYQDEVIAAQVDMEKFSLNQISKMTDIHEELLFFKKPTDLFSFNEQAINFDFEILTEGKISQKLSSSNGFLGNIEDLFIEEGAEIELANINCKTGKIYIDKNAEIMEGSNVRGPFTLGKSSKINMGSKIYGATTIGPHCKIGGEVNNIVIFGFSNKGHEGFLGNSVIGEWCNLGADSNASNLKNNYASVKLWNYHQKKFLDTGLQFCGLIMGDHSKSAINTQFNTGTVVGVGANIFKSGFPPNVIEHFSWGGMKGDEKFNFKKALEVAEKAMGRRKLTLSEEDKAILGYLYNTY